MKVSVSAGLYYTKPYEEILDILAEAGVENLEILLNTAFIDVPVNDLQKALIDRSLKVLSVHLPFTKMAYDRDQDEDFWIEKGLEYLAILGGDTIVSHFFYQKSPDRLSNDEFHFPVIEKHTKENPKFCITTENLPLTDFKTKHQDRKGLFDFLSERECFLTYDTTHAATHGQNILDDLDFYFNHIRNIHFSDFADGQEHKVIGTGKQPIKPFLHKLSERKYQYSLTLEYDFENISRNDIKSDKDAVRSIRESLQLINDVVL